MNKNEYAPGEIKRDGCSEPLNRVDLESDRQAGACIDCLQKNNTILKAFVKEFIDTEAFGYVAEVDGAGVREVAVKMGILKEAELTESDIEKHRDTDFDLSVGDTWYVYTDIMK